MTELSARTVLVTGGTSGIGRAAAARLLEQGARVIVSGRDLDRLSSEPVFQQPHCRLERLDVTDGADVAALPGRLDGPWRDVDTLVVSAGQDIGGRRPFHEGDAADWCDTIETNVNGVIRVVHAFMDRLLASARGHVVTLGSVAGLRTYPGGAAYSPSKYAVRAFTDALRQDYRTRPLRVTEILPGLVKTRFAEVRLRGDLAGAAHYYDDAPGYLEPEDVAETILYALKAPPHVNISQLVVVPTANK